jgi:hypothetical protein
MRKIYILFSALLFIQSVKAQDVMMEAWYWNYPKTAQGHIWMDTLANKAHLFSKYRFTALWLPPMNLAQSTTSSNGYDTWDLFNVGGINNINTGFGNRTHLIKLMDSLNKNNLIPIADMVYNQRTGGTYEPNPVVQNFITTYNGSTPPYPSDRVQMVLPLGGNTGLDSGIYYLKIKSPSGKFGNYLYQLTITNRRIGYNGKQLTEHEPNGGGDCGQKDDTIYLGDVMNASIDASGCGVDEFALTINKNNYLVTGDTLYISFTNNTPNGSAYADQYIYGIWYSKLNEDVVNHLIYRTATNFNIVPSKRGQMHWHEFHPNGNPTCFCLDYDYPLFFYDYDQVTDTPCIDTLQTWTKWMWDSIGARSFRFDATKNYDPVFTGGMLNYLHNNGMNPHIIVGEYYDANPTNLQNHVTQVYSNMSQSTDDAINYRVFDFALQAELKNACDAFGEDVRNLFNKGMVDGVSENGRNVVTFVNNHDFRDSSQSINDDPILAYAYILTNPSLGIPCVYYADYISAAHPTYYNAINKLNDANFKFLQNAQNKYYLTTQNGSGYSSNWDGDNLATTTLIYELSGTSNTCLNNPTSVVALNFAGEELKVDQQVDVSSPFNLSEGDTLVDILGNSNFPYAIVKSGSIYVDLPARSYSIWVKTSLVKTPTISATGVTSFCHGDTLKLHVSKTYPCYMYQWYQNGKAITDAIDSVYNVTESGIYMAQASYDGGNAENSNTISVTVSPDQPAITTKEDTLTCMPSATSYQWLYGKTASSLSPIPNSNEQTIIGDSTGYYAVENFDANNCSNESTPYHLIIVTTGISSPALSSFIHIFPNPASDLLNVQINLPWNEMEIRNGLGNLVQSRFNSSHQKSQFTIAISEFSSGLYWIVVKTLRGNVELKFVKL